MFDSFDFLDISGDDQLSFDEFSIIANSHKAFDAIDFNHDSYVDKNELENAIRMLDKESTTGQVTAPPTTPPTVSPVHEVTSTSSKAEKP